MKEEENEENKIEAPSIISGEMELTADIEEKKSQLKKTLRNVPVIEKVDIGIDELYSDYYYAELQLKLKEMYDKVNSSIRKVGDYLDINHVRLKDRDITYKEIATALNLTESQVYAAVQNLQIFEGYSFVFHPTRKKHAVTDDYGSFRYSADDYVGWSKENDIREKVITRKVVVIRRSQDKMFPKHKEKIMKHKMSKIQELKARIAARQAPQNRENENENDNEEERT